MQLRSGRSDNQLWRNAPKPPPYTLTHTTHTSTYLHPVKMQNQLTDVCVCVCMSQMFTVMAKPIVSSGHMKTDISILYCETTFIMNTVIDTNTPRSIPALTVTDPLADKTPHASGRVWYWGPPSSPGRTPRHIHKPYMHFIVGLKLHTHPSHLRAKIPPPIQVPAFSFTLPLFYPSLCLFLPAASQPTRREVTS